MYIDKGFYIIYIYVAISCIKKFYTHTHTHTHYVDT